MTLDEVADAIRALPDDVRPRTGAWTAAQVLDHCAAAIEGSMTGYPELRPAWFRATIGRLVLAWFLLRGRMSHDRNGVVPGVPVASPDLPLADARRRLLAAIDAFRAFEGVPKDHFVYGAVARDAYARLHAMHLADHLADLTHAGEQT